MIHRILVPLDGSRLAEGVLPFVEEMARGLRAEVTFIQVTEPEWPKGVLESGNWEGGLPLPSTEKAEAAEAYLSQLAREWRNRDVKATWEVLQGLPAPSIIDFAHEHQVDLIAMSTHGRAGLRRLVFGSVAEEVLRGAGSPVLLLKADQSAAFRRLEAA